jgi:hypothetical protein
MSSPDPFDATAAPDQGTSALAKTITSMRASAEKLDTESDKALPVAWQRYELHQEIGAGGMGRVYGATDRQFGRKIAVKQLLRPERGEARERFELESFVTGNLEHPGIPAVYERGQDQANRPFYSMRHVQGRTLGEAISDCGSLDERLRLVPVLIRVAQTLAYAHSQGVVHRDIKPDNIILGSHGETFVLDWGIAKIRGIAQKSGASSSGEAKGSGDSTATQDGQVIGTPAYMAPEQAAGAIDRIDERTDVFALGAILYHLLTGHSPYRSGSLEEVLEAAKDRRVADLEQAAAEAPSGLREICAQAIEKESSDRFASAGDMARALENFAASAISNESCGPVGFLSTAVSVVSVVMALIVIAVTLGTVASLEAQGYGAKANFFFAGFGILFSIIEYRTRGRFQLAPLALGLAVVTMLNGVASTFTGITNTFDMMMQPELFEDHEAYREIATLGTRESLSNLASSASLTMVQVLAWAIARRRKLLG